MKVKRTERGWAGHFIGASSCLFRRNTLLECGDERIVVSTVGAYKYGNKVEQIGYNRYYETMAFEARFDGNYWEADVTKEITFESERGIYGTTFSELPDDVDNKADQMHETVVEELMKSMSERAKNGN